MRVRFSLFSLLFILMMANGANAQFISTFAGNGAQGYSGDGGACNLAELNSCTAITFNGAGNVYIADMGNNVVRMVNPSGIISTLAGTGAAGFSGDGGLAVNATLKSPAGVAIDASGNVYIADMGNNRIRVVHTNGIITTFAGNGIAGLGIYA